MYIWVGDIELTPVYTIFQLDFTTTPTVWHYVESEWSFTE